MYRNFSVKLFALITLLLFGAGAANSQTCISTNTACGIPVTQDFSAGNGSFTASGTGSPNLIYNSTGKNFQIGTISNGIFTAGSTSQNKTYILTSGSYLAANQTTVGFVYGGDAKAGTVTVDILNASNAVIQSCSIPGTNNGSYCFTFNNNALSGQTVKFRITFPSRTGNGGGVQGNLTFDDFRVAFVELSPTPVKFAGFEGKKTAKGTALTWSVGSEVNVKSYDVERSSNGNNGFVKIGSVYTTGNSSYTFTDETNTSGAVFYRIKNIDNDGRFAYSTILSFRNGSSAILFRVVPTLVINNTKVQHPAATSSASITLSGADGRQVRNIRPATGAVETTVDMANLRPGLYLLKWSDDGAMETTKVVKQ